MLRIRAPTPAPQDPGPASTGSRLGFFGDQNNVGMMTAAGVILALIGVIIAYLAWRGDVVDRQNAGGGQSEPTSPSTPPSTSPSTFPSTSPPASPSAVPGTGLAEKPAKNPAGPARTNEDTPGATTPAAKTVPLRYQLGASAIDERTVRVAATTSGAPEAATAYWFILEVDWRDGNTDYYPRKDLKGAPATFDVGIPADASTEAVRTGRVYALTRSQAAQAQVLLDRQSKSTDADDFFDTPPGEAKSKGVRMPY